MKPLFLLLSFLGLVPALAGTAETGEMKMAIYRTPPSFFIRTEISDGKVKKVPAEGVKRVEPSPFFGEDEVYDIRPYLEAIGVTCPPDSQALLLAKSGFVFLKNTPENLEYLVDSSGGCPIDAPTIIRNEISVVNLGPAEKFSQLATPIFSQLKQAAGDSWEPLSTLEIVTKSGLQAQGTSSAAILPIESKTAGPLEAPPLAAGDTGIACAVVTTVGADSRTIDSSVAFRYQAPKDKAGKTATLTYSGSVTLQDGEPMILQYFSGNETQPAHAVILRITIAGPDSLPIHSADRKPSRL